MAGQVEREENAGDVSLIRQKIGAGIRADDTAADALAQAIGRSLAQSAFGLWGLNASPVKHVSTCCHTGDMRGIFSSDNLLIVLERADGTRAALMFDAVFVSSVIQKQTLGCVIPHAVPNRQFTSTDASLIRPLCEGMVQQAVERVASQGLAHLLDGFEFGARVLDVQSLLLLLSEKEHFVLRSEFEIESDQRVGCCTCVFPNALAYEGEDAAPDEPFPTLEVSSGVMRAQLTAVLARTAMSPDAILELSPGDELSVPINLDVVEIATITGEVVAQGRLGRIAGNRAVRLHDKKQHLPSIHASGAEFVEKLPYAHESGDKERVNKADRLVLASDETSGPHGDDITDMTPAEAAAEITQLAGLTDEPVSA